ncbi:hypothetical protein [Streptomyces sp. NPDC001714]|uniref:hypothetical protein n=1 Tax=Streptomyces sp. NPDC001714 TaxID=3364603 RepID=UPI003695EFEC
MSADGPLRAGSTVMHVRCPDRAGQEVYRQVLEVLSELSPTVQAAPPAAALVELRGALGYFGTTAQGLADMLRLRTAARLGMIDVRVGIGPSITVAATVSHLRSCRTASSLTWDAVVASIEIPDPM